MFERFVSVAEDEKRQQMFGGSLKPSQKNDGFPKQFPKFCAAGMLIHRILLPWIPTRPQAALLRQHVALGWSIFMVRSRAQALRMGRVIATFRVKKHVHLVFSKFTISHVFVNFVLQFLYRNYIDAGNGGAIYTQVMVVQYTRR